MGITVAEVRFLEAVPRELRDLALAIKNQPPQPDYIERLRDELAIAALPTLMQVSEREASRQMLEGEGFGQLIARKAWEIADFVIAAREKKT